MKTVICDQCGAEVGARGLSANIEPTSDLRSYAEEPVEAAVDFCSYRCLGAWALDRAKLRREARADA